MDAIVVASSNWGIGLDGQLLFSLPTDMKRFRALTMGGSVLMGRKTLESFPGGKPLAGRKNIVLTRGEQDLSDVITVGDLHEALAAVEGTNAFVIGGGSIYVALLPYCDRVRVTRVDAHVPADTFFPNLDAHPDWEKVSESEPIEENGLLFRYVDYKNLAKKTL